LLVGGNRNAKNPSVLYCREPGNSYLFYNKEIHVGTKEEGVVQSKVVTSIERSREVEQVRSEWIRPDGINQKEWKDTLRPFVQRPLRRCLDDKVSQQFGNGKRVLAMIHPSMSMI